MTATTHPEFNDKTEGLEVAKVFSDSIRGKTILITGVNIKGVGYAVAQAFASQSPAHLILAGRDQSKIQECIDGLKKDYPTVDSRILTLDLSTQATVRTAASELLSWSDIPTIDILINNAAVMNLPERILNSDGIEMHFATNHIGHFLFANLIMPKLIASSQQNPKGTTRIINVSSLSPTRSSMRWSDINFDKINSTLPESEQPPYEVHKVWGTTDPENKSYVPIEGYNQSKVANVLFSIALNHRLYAKHGILSFTVHPGVISTELSRYATPETKAAIKDMMKAGVFQIQTLGMGASTPVVAATDPKLSLPVAKREEDGKENVGVYLVHCQISDKATDGASSSEGAERLWGLSEELVKEKFTW